MDDGASIVKKPVLPSSLSLILVSIIPTPRDLEIARVLGWYRIPFRYAPKVVRVDYVAFYQPSSFGKSHSGMVESFAEVKGIELTTRAELIKDEPDHPRATEEYYKVQVGGLQFLEKPIIAGRWKRITFLYTTGELFSSANTVRDLVVKTEERKILWHSLREKASQFQEYQQVDLPNFANDPDLVMMLGDLELIRDEQNWYHSI
jgi:hypothetical protein